MLEAVPVTTRRDKREFIEFIYRVYAGNPNFKDSLMSVVASFLRGGDRFVRAARVMPIRVVDNGTTRAQCMLITHLDTDMLMVGFFEALERSEDAVRLIVDEARKVATREHKKRIFAGLNGHVAYGVGFLADGFDLPASFDSLYSMPQYPAYWRPFSRAELKLTAYQFELAAVQFPDRLLARVKQRFSLRTMVMRRFKEEIELLGRLSNECLCDTPLYFQRDPKAMVELIAPLRFFLRPEHLIFACDERGVECGFVFWHPDFNEVIAGGRKNSIASIALSYLWRGRRIKTVKVNAIGVQKKHQSTGVTAALLSEAVRHARERYSTAETNFVFDTNTKSVLLNRHFPHRQLRHYSVFEIPVETAI